MKYIKSFKFWTAFLVVVYTLTGFVIIPWFITNKVPAILKNKIGINLTLGKTSFNPYTYELTLRDIKLDDLNKKTVFMLKKFYVDYIFLGILTKTFIFNNVSLDSAKLYATITKSGDLNLMNIMPKTTKKTKSKTSNKSSLPSILLTYLNIKNGQIIVKDERDNKHFTANLGPYNFVAHDISTDKNELNAYTFKTLINGKSKLLWKGGMSISPLKLYGEITIKKLDLPQLYRYALPNIGANLKQGSLFLSLPYQIDMSKKIEIKINNAKLKLANINLSDKKSGKTLIDTKSVTLTDFNMYWPRQSVLIDTLKVDGTNLYAKLAKDGMVDLLKAFKIKSKSKKQEQNTTASKPWKYLLKNALIDDANIYFENQQLKIATKTEISKLSLHVKNISSNKKEQIKYKMTSKLNQKSNISIFGYLIQKPLSNFSHIKLSNILPVEYINYINPYINFKLKNASIDADIDAHVNLEKKLKLTLESNTSISNLNINSKNNQKLLSWKKLSINDFALQWPRQKVKIKNISLDKAFVSVKLKKNTDINLLKAFMPKRGKNKQVKTKSKPWKYLLKSANIDKTTVLFLDESLKTPTKSKLSKISLHASDISSNKKNSIKYKLALTLNKNSKIKASGSARQSPLSTKSKLNIKNMQLSDFENYLAPYVNFKIKKAGFNLNANINANLEHKPNIKVYASTFIKKLRIDTNKNEKLLAWKNLNVNGIKKLNKPFIVAHIAKDRSKKKKAESKSIKIKIGPMKLVNGSTDYSDDSLPFPFHTLIHDLNGNISTLDFGSTTPSVVKLDGKIDKYGYAEKKSKYKCIV